MAHNLVLAKASVDAAADAVCQRCDGGTLSIYSGARPKTPEQAVTRQVLLATLRFGSPAFAPAKDGVATARPFAGAVHAVDDGTATWFRVCASDGAVVFDGSVGRGNADLLLPEVIVLTDDLLVVEALTYVQPSRVEP